MILVSTFFALLGRELRLSMRNVSEIALPVLFLILCVMMFPFAVGANAAKLSTVAAGAIWVSALLALTFSLEQLFTNDFENGTLELFIVHGLPMPLVCLAKSMAHWLRCGLPVTLLAVPLGLSLHLDGRATTTLFTALGLGSMTLSMVGTAASALAVGLRNGGALLALLILPLYIPVLIFGASATSNAAQGLSAEAAHYFLGGVWVLALTLSPWASAAAVRIRLS